MGHRASYAIREEGRTTLFFASFGAVTLLVDVFFGPDECEAQIRRQERSDEWIDDEYGEAAVALCKDERTVAFFDCRLAEDTQQTAARIMQALWPEWEIVSAHAASEVAAVIGIEMPAPPDALQHAFGELRNNVPPAPPPASKETPLAEQLVQLGSVLLVDDTARENLREFVSRALALPASQAEREIPAQAVSAEERRARWLRALESAGLHQPWHAATAVATPSTRASS